MKILLVDDDAVIRRGMCKIIEKSNVECTVTAQVSDGAYALDILKEVNDIDLLITDIRMPVMDGLELIKKVREFNTTIKIIVVSGFDDYKYVRNAFLDGAVEYLLKPITQADFIGLLDKMKKDIVKDEVAAEQREKSHSLLLIDTLEKVFHHQNEQTPYNEDILRELKLTFLDHYVILITRIDQSYKEILVKQELERKLEQALTGIREWAEECLHFKIHQYIIRSEIISILFVEESFDLQTPLSNLFQSLQEYTEDKSTFTCSLGVSNIHCSFQEVSKSYEEAYQAVEARFYMGRNKCILYPDIENKCIDMTYDLQPNVTQLAHYIGLCDYVNARRIMELIFLDLSYIYPDKIRRFMSNIIEMLNIRIKDFEKSVICNQHDYSFHIKTINTYNELRSYMLLILRSSINYIEEEKERKSKRRIEMAKEYIEHHYMNFLTLNNVADYIELNASYFSNLFKIETGVKFSDYLLDIRMGKAMQLLKDPKIKVYEIGNKVGYEDAVSFGRAFKKKIGMSPKEYRNSVY